MNIEQTYVLNLNSSSERMALMQKRLEFIGIKNWRRFQAISGKPFSFFRQKLDNERFVNDNYLATSLSHLSIYAEVLEKGYSLALILEDDVRIHRDFHNLLAKLPSDFDTMHLGYIPLSDDLSMWDYTVVTGHSSESILGNIFPARNLWGLFAYVVTPKFCKHMLEIYNSSFPMEIDRYLVNCMFPDPNFRNLGSSPQLFCHDDGVSSNSGRAETQMIQRSVDVRYSAYHDYV